MSISQTARFLTGLSKDEPKPKYYFMYEDHFSHEAFQRHFVATKRVTIGLLKDWTWHINSKHKPNIRFTFQDHERRPEGPLVAPATEFAPHAPKIDGTFGFVIELTPELESLLARTYSGTRVAMVQNISFYVKNPYGAGNLQFLTKALVYWDPHHTADGYRKNLLGNVRQREKWKSGLVTLKSIGVPNCFLNAVQRRLVGECVDPEPLFSSFARVPQSVMPNHLQTAYYNHQRLDNLPTPQTSRQRISQQMLSIPLTSDLTPNTPIIQPKPAVQGSMTGPPKPSVQYHSAIQSPIGPSPSLITPMLQQSPSIQGSMNSLPRSDKPMAHQKQGATGPPARPLTSVQPKLPFQATMGPRLGLDDPMVQYNTAAQGSVPQNGESVIQYRREVQDTMGPLARPAPSHPTVPQNSAFQYPAQQNGRAIPTQSIVYPNTMIQQKIQQNRQQLVQPSPATQNQTEQSKHSQYRDCLSDAQRNAITQAIIDQYGRDTMQKMSQPERHAVVKALLLQYAKAIANLGTTQNGIHAQMAPDGKTIQIVCTKRKEDSSRDELMEDTKRLKRDGSTGGKPVPKD